MIKYLLNAISFISGIVCISSAIFLYEDEEGKVQNKLENLWISLDDIRIAALKAQTAFVVKSAKLSKKALDGLFGKKLFSKRSIGVSGWLSLSSLALSAVAVVALAKYVPVHQSLRLPRNPFLLFTREGFLTYVGLLRVGLYFTLPSSMLVSLMVAFLGIGLVYISSKNPRFKDLPFYTFLGLISVPTILVVLFMLEISPIMDIFLSVPEYLLVTLLIGILFDILFIAASRSILKWQANSNKFFAVLSISVIQLSLAAILLYGPIVASRYAKIFGKTVKTFWISIFTSSMTNWFSALVALTFFIIALLLLAHTLIWPVIMRSTYILQRLKIFKASTFLPRLLLVVLGLWLIGRVFIPAGKLLDKILPLLFTQ